jgi:hypothetical protein
MNGVGIVKEAKMAVDIDIQRIQEELQELAGRQQKVKVGLNTRIDVACSIRQTDKGFEFRFNPKRYRGSRKKFEEHLNWCRETLLE